MSSFNLQEFNETKDNLDFPDYLLQKKCVGNCNLKCMTIILDLDETLIRTFDKGEKIPIPRHHPDYFSFDLRGNRYEGMKRPNLDFFLSKIYRLATRIIIFTAAKPDYARKVVDIIFANMPYKPDHIFTYVDCESDPSYIKKPLDLVINKFPDEISRDRTIVLDDKQCVYFLKDIENIAQVTPFTGEINDSTLKRAYYNIKYLWRKEKSVVDLELEKLRL